MNSLNRSPASWRLGCQPEEGEAGSLLESVLEIQPHGHALGVCLPLALALHCLARSAGLASSPGCAHHLLCDPELHLPGWAATPARGCGSGCQAGTQARMEQRRGRSARRCMEGSFPICAVRWPQRSPGSFTVWKGDMRRRHEAKIHDGRW